MLCHFCLKLLVDGFFIFLQLLYYGKIYAHESTYLYKLNEDLVMNVFDSATSVLIIGNGFDRNCGLNTRFKDVYKAYFGSPSKDELIKNFKSDIKSDLENWSDFEFSMSQYAQKFDSEDAFLLCLDDFSSFMHSYLNSIQDDFYNVWNKLATHKETFNSFKNSIYRLGQGVSHNLDDYIITNRANDISSMGFISLNYTLFLDTFLKLCFKIEDNKVMHVHGKLGDDPILGMDRVEQLKLKFPVSDRLKRHFIKPFFNEEYDTKRISHAKDMINGANFIYVYGASLGESDLSWRESLINWLCNNENHHLFLYFHRNEELDSSVKSIVLDSEIAEKNRIISEWGIIKDDIPFNRLHVPCGIKLFNLKNAVDLDIAESQKFQEFQKAIR